MRKKINKGDPKMRAGGRYPTSISPDIWENSDGKDMVRKHGLGKNKKLIVVAICNLNKANLLNIYQYTTGLNPITAVITLNIKHYRPQLNKDGQCR